MDISRAMSRRRFLGGSRAEELCRIAPPGATAESLENCTGCGACVDSCPVAIITMTGNRPSLDFSSSECLLCGKCADACPEPVFGENRRFEHVMEVGSHCLAKNAVACQSCGDVCASSAILFRAQLGLPFTPEVDATTCNGCGACVAICPVLAIDVKRPVPESVNA